MIATAAPAVELGTFARGMVFALCNCVFGLAGNSTCVANALNKEALALKHALSNFLDMLTFVLRQLHSRKDEWELLALVHA